MSDISYKLLHRMTVQDDGPSHELLDLVRTIFDNTVADGRPRHSEQARQNLLKVLAGHSYAKVIFPVCHFLSVSAQNGVALYHWFAMSQPVTARSLGQGLQSAVSTPVGRRHQTIIEASHHTQTFDVNLVHIARHSALLDLILEVIGYDQLEALYNRLATAKNRHDVTAISNDISREMYHFLKDHMATASAEKKAKSLRNFVAARYGQDHRISVSDIDDELIVDFWIQVSLDTDSKFRLYTNCVQNWVTFRHAIRAATSNQFQQEASLDALNEQGQAALDRIDQQTAETMFDDASDDALIGSQLGKISPAELQMIKLVTATEHDQIAQLLDFGDDGPALIVTILRLLTFGPVQARLIEASRQKKTQLNAMDGFVDTTAYDVAIDQIKQLHDTIQGLAEAAAFSLYLARSPAFVYAALPLAEKAEQKAMRDFGAIVRSRLTGPIDEQELIAQISAALLDSAADVMPRLLHRLQHAKKKFRRKGLGKLPTEDVETWTAELASGIEILSRLAPPLNRLVSNNPAIITAQSNTPSLQARCIADRDLFFDHFRQIYGQTA
jgi:hypothetical protein